jgi:hypothetical protein
MKKLLFTFILLSLLWMGSSAQVVVKPGTWPTMCQGGAYVMQINPIVIKETLPTDFATQSGRVYQISCPAGYQFDLNSHVTTFYSTGGGSITPSYGPNVNPLFIVFNPSSSTIDSIVITGLKIRAFVGAATSAIIVRENCSAPSNCGTGLNHTQNGNMITDGLIHGTFNSLINPFPNITFVPDAFYCDLDNVNYTLTGTPSGGTWAGTGVSTGLFNSFGLSPNTYSLTYSVNNGPCTNQSSINVVVKSSPSVAIVSDDADNVLCDGQTVTFTASASGSNKRYQFYKNNIPVTTISTTNTYTTTTILNGDVISVAADNGNLTCQRFSSSITMSVVTPSIIVSLPTLPPLVCSNISTGYTIQSTYPGGTYSGNGVSGNTFTPSLATVGTNTISYFVNYTSCSYTITKDVIVTAAPTVNIVSSDADNVICEGDAVTFTANTGGTANRFLFLKNGNGIQGPNSTNTFLTNGLINNDIISVTIDNGASTCATTSSGITTTVGKKPKAQFTWQNTCGSNLITFANTSTVSGASTINGFAWDFDNNAVTDALTASAVYTYPAPNEYYARLTVTTDKFCTDNILTRVYALPGVTPTASAPYSVNFKTNSQGWIPDGTNYSWGWTTGKGIVNSNSDNTWTTGSLTGGYNLNENSFLYGPCFDFTNLIKPMIALKIWSDIYLRRGGTVLEASTDDGASWQRVGAVGDGINWYNANALSSSPGQTNPGDYGWTDKYINWKIAKMSLQQYAGAPNVRIRLAFASPSTNTYIGSGIALDSVYVGERIKKVLVEQYTNTYCTTCTTEDNYLIGLQNSRPNDIISIHYHTNYSSGDPYYSFQTADPGSRESNFGSGLSIPYSMVDGNYYKTSIADVSGAIDINRIETRALEDHLFDIDITTQVSTSQIKVSYNVKKSSLIETEANNEDVKIIVATVQDVAGANRFIERKLLPGQGGSFYWSPPTFGQTITGQEIWDDPGLTAADLNELYFVVFVEGATTKKIYNANKIKGTGSTGAPVVTDINKKIIELNHFVLFPNPANEEVTILFTEKPKENSKLEIIDQYGKSRLVQIIETGNVQITLNTSYLSGGIYYVKITNNEYSLTEKLLLTK